MQQECPDRRTIRSSKSDSALSTRDKGSSLSSDEGSDLETYRVTSKSSLGLSQGGGDDVAPTTLHSQLSYSVSPTIDVNSVPYTSYSSSDDDDDDAEFFDADEFHDFDKPIVRMSR